MISLPSLSSSANKLLPSPCRQEKLDQLAVKFSRKASLRESWLTDMNQVLDELDRGQDVHAVDAALKRHEAISADVHAGVSEGMCLRVSAASTH